MNKLKLKAINLGIGNFLTRDQLKNAMGGVGSGNTQCGSCPGMPWSPYEGDYNVICKSMPSGWDCTDQGGQDGNAMICGNEDTMEFQVISCN